MIAVHRQSCKQKVRVVDPLTAALMKTCRLVFTLEDLWTVLGIGRAETKTGTPTGFPPANNQIIFDKAARNQTPGFCNFTASLPMCPPVLTWHLIWIVVPRLSSHALGGQPQVETNYNNNQNTTCNRDFMHCILQVLCIDLNVATQIQKATAKIMIFKSVRLFKT